MMAKKKVLFLVNHDVVIYNFRKELVQKLLESGYEVLISSPYGERIEKLIEMGCRYQEIKLDRHGKNPFAELGLLRAYRSLIKAERPSAVLTFTIKPVLYGAWAAEKEHTPCIANITGLGTALEKQGILQKALLCAYKRCLRKVECVFFQNKSNQEFFKQHRLVRKKEILLPGSGVNTEEFAYETYPKRPKEETRFLFVGRVMKEKGIDEYLEAAEKIKEIYPEVEFDIVGFMDGEYGEVLREKEEAGIIHYYGQQMDVKPFYRQANAVVLPSYHEGMANVLLEAASMGRPILATKVPGCQETFDEGSSGLGFEKGNAKELFRTMKKFIEFSMEEKEALGKKAREKMEQQFNREIVVNTYMKIINGL